MKAPEHIPRSSVLLRRRIWVKPVEVGDIVLYLVLVQSRTRDPATRPFDYTYRHWKLFHGSPQNHQTEHATHISRILVCQYPGGRHRTHRPSPFEECEMVVVVVNQVSPSRAAAMPRHDSFKPNACDFQCMNRRRYMLYLQPRYSRLKQEVDTDIGVVESVRKYITHPRFLDPTYRTSS